MLIHSLEVAQYFLQPHLSNSHKETDTKLYSLLHYFWIISLLWRKETSCMANCLTSQQLCSVLCQNPGADPQSHKADRCNKMVNCWFSSQLYTGLCQALDIDPVSWELQMWWCGQLLILLPATLPRPRCGSKV